MWDNRLVLNANYQRAMFHYVRKCTANRLRELAGPRRLATLTCFLRQSYRDTIDQAVDMFDKIIIRMQVDTARRSKTIFLVAKTSIIIAGSE